MHDNRNKYRIINIRIPNIPGHEIVNRGQTISSPYSHILDISCLEMAEKESDFKLSSNLVASFETGPSRVGAARSDDKCCWANLRLELASSRGIGCKRI
jgi:hypothetical protein